jgi:hypothetical protein
MGEQKRNRRQRQKRMRRLSVRGVRRDPPDMRRLGQALIGLAAAELERQAQEQNSAVQNQENKPASGGGGDDKHSG